MKLALEIAYDGSGYAGFARQPHRRTVEDVLHHALDAVYKGVSELAVAGRTDTGVHALRQVVSVRVQAGPPIEACSRAVTAALPPDVCVRAARIVPDAFHARHSARVRAYLYRVATAPTRPVFSARRVYHHPRRLDQALLDRCAAAVVGSHDFTAFTPTETQHTDFVRTILSACWQRRAAELWFVVRADRFLRHQVRIMAGTMLSLAAGQPLPVSFAALLDGAARSQAGPTAPPHGLYLVGVGFAGDGPGTELAGLADTAPDPA